MSSGYEIGTRLFILSLGLLSLVVAGLNSANARFAVILNQAISDELKIVEDTLDKIFQSFLGAILINSLITSVITALFGLCGTVLVVHPRGPHWLWVYGLVQIFVACIFFSTGGFLADHVYDFQASIDKFSAKDGIPYYRIMYIGGHAQAAYGAFLILCSIALCVIGLIGALLTTRRRSEELKVRNDDVEKP